MHCASTLALILLVAPAATLAAPTVQAQFLSDVVGGTHSCPDHQQSCLDGEPCCRFDSSGYGCCGGGNTEACCSDDQGGVCCVSQPTYCVPKDQYPARCCPRETVGCSGGTVGCCNPARAWQRGNPLHPMSSPRRPTKINPATKTNADEAARVRSSRAPTSVVASAAGTLAYALFVNGMGSMNALSVNVTSGEVVSKVAVTGFNNWGESTRDFCWDSQRKLFYSLDVNFTALPSRPASGRPITLSKIDPTTGATTSVPVTGAVDYVAGYSMHSSGKIHAAAESRSSDGKTVEGWHFFLVDPETGKAETIATLPRDASNETDAAFYGGFHRSIGAAGAEAYRVGYKSVSGQYGPGVGVVKLPQIGENAVPEASWEPLVAPDNHGFYLGALARPGDRSFLSLAPDTQTQYLSLVSWAVGAKDAPSVTPLGNVTSPGVMGEGALGFTLDSVRFDSADGEAGLYVALVDSPSPVPIPFPGAWDQWSVVSVDLASKDVHVVKMQPGLLEGSNSASGFGI